MPTRSTSRRAPLLRAIALAAVPLLAAPLAAQEARQPENLVSTNPFLFAVGWYGLEYERRLSEGTTFAVGTSFFSYEDVYEDDGEEEYFSADVKLRYYPGERAFRGLSLGASAGYVRVSEDLVTDAQLDAVSLGFALDYGWLLGRRDNVHLGVGVGIRRLLYIDEDDRVDAVEALPSLRFSVGFAW